jgi:hypothetical protein
MTAHCVLMASIGEESRLRPAFSFPQRNDLFLHELLANRDSMRW